MNDLTQRLRRALLRAGAFRAWHGGQAGSAQVGLTVPVTASTLAQVLDTLSTAQAKATLLVPMTLAQVAPDTLRQAARAGHELAGRGSPAGLSLLEATAAQPILAWDGTDLRLGELRSLAAQGIQPLPLPSSTPEHGHALLVSPEVLGAQLASLKKQGFQGVPVRDLPGLRLGTPRDLLFRLYELAVEERFTQGHLVINLTERADGVMRVAPLDHAPDPLPLPRQTPTAELHLHSARLVGLAERNLLATYRAYQRSLKDVARAMQTHEALQDAQAVFAVTLFHGPLEKSGFELLELPPLRARWYGLGFRLLRVAYGTTRTPSVATPKMAWMSREDFLARYG